MVWTQALGVYLLLEHCETVPTLSTDAKSSVVKPEQHVPPVSLHDSTETWDSTCPCGIPGPSLPLCRDWQGSHICYCKHETLGSKLVVTALLPLVICMHKLLYYRLQSRQQTKKNNSSFTLGLTEHSVFYEELDFPFLQQRWAEPKLQCELYLWSLKSAYNFKASLLILECFLWVMHSTGKPAYIY